MSYVVLYLVLGRLVPLFIRRLARISAPSLVEMIATVHVKPFCLRARDTVRQPVSFLCILNLCKQLMNTDAV
jgi:hypothetical protein